ncbi:hypothetical protein [Nostoc commune]|nr:hypothetical protein [Nostoc commune]
MLTKKRVRIGDRSSNGRWQTWRGDRCRVNLRRRHSVDPLLV